MHIVDISYTSESLTWQGRSLDDMPKFYLDVIPNEQKTNRTNLPMITSHVSYKNYW